MIQITRSRVLAALEDSNHMPHCWAGVAVTEYDKADSYSRRQIQSRRTSQSSLLLGQERKGMRKKQQTWKYARAASWDGEDLDTEVLVRRRRRD
jgi:hypothetical protein